MNTEIVEITPDMAIDYLASMATNRPLSKNTVKKYADDMAHGRWKFSHQGVAFDNRGRLMDGQHRLAAIVESEVTIRMVVTTGVPTESFDVMDKGKRRSAADIYALMGGQTKHLKGVVSTAKAMLQADANVNMRDRDVADHAMKHEDLIALIVSKVYSRKQITAWCPAPVRAAFTNLCIEHGVDAVMPFIDEYVRDLYTDSSNPLKRLHDKLVGAKMAGRRIPPPELYVLAHKAVTAAMEGRRLSKLVYTKSRKAGHKPIARPSGPQHQ